MGSILAGGPIVDEFFSTVPGWFFDMCTIQLEPKTHYPSELTVGPLSRATQQGNMAPYHCAVYWLQTARSVFLLNRKCNCLAVIMVMTCVMRYTWNKTSDLSGPTVHSLYYDMVVLVHATTVWPTL